MMPLCLPHYYLALLISAVLGMLFFSLSQCFFVIAFSIILLMHGFFFWLGALALFGIVVSCDFIMPCFSFLVASMQFGVYIFLFGYFSDVVICKFGNV